MPNEYLRLNDTQFNIRKAENLLAIIADKRKDKIERKEVQSENSLLSELWKAFRSFFSNLGKPTLQKRFQRKESPARSDEYNQAVKETYDDIHVAYAEEDSLASMMVKNFNYGEAARQMLLNKVKKLGSRSIDYSFYSIGTRHKCIFGVDNFTDNEKIDFEKISAEIPAVELDVSQGVITLKRSGNINKADLVERVTDIKESLPAWNPQEEEGGYEGLYFGMQNEVRPETGDWHLEYSEDGNNLYEMGASEEELMPYRLKMFDDNPDTFWEIEYVTKSIVGYENKYSGNQITVAEFNDLVNNELNSPNVEIYGDTIVTDERGRLIESYIPVTQKGPIEYLVVNFTAYLSKAEIINWISLNPNNFGYEAYIDILSIQTSSDGKTFEELEGFDDHEYDMTLTSEVNSELTPKTMKDVLSPDKFKYAGQGIWIFAPRKVKAVRFSVRQTRAYPKKYEVLMVETEQHITVTTTKSSWWGGTKTSTDHSTIKKQHEIPYLMGHVSGFDTLDLEPGRLENRQVPLKFIEDPIGWIFGSSKKTETSIGPQTITRQWHVTKDDRSRFAISVRDINLYSYKFAEVSEMVSIPYFSPKAISKISLTVDEQVPKIFYSNMPGTENDWIKYYISVDDGASWRRISPIHHRDTPSGDGVNNVPEIININSDIREEDRTNPLAYVDTDESIYQIRFKAVLSRPPQIPDAESYTPVLSKYALQIYPMGGL